MLAPALGGEAQDLPARVVRRALAHDHAVVVQPGDEPAELAGVHVERLAQLGDLDRLGAPQLEDHARLGQRVA